MLDLVDHILEGGDVAEDGAGVLRHCTNPRWGGAVRRETVDWLGLASVVFASASGNAKEMKSNYAVIGAGMFDCDLYLKIEMETGNTDCWK